MSYRDLSPGVQEINAALDRERAARGLRNDKELARYFQVSYRIISHWRNGKFTRTQAALAAVLTGDESILTQPNEARS